MAPDWSLILRLWGGWKNNKEGLRAVLSTISHISLGFLSSLGSWRLWRGLKCSWEGFLCFSAPAVTFVFPSASVLHIWQADTKALFHPCSSCCGWHFIQVEERAGLTRAADEETEPESRECLNPSWRRASPEVEKHHEKKRRQSYIRMHETVAQIQQGHFTGLKKRLVNRQQTNWLQ